MADKIQLRRGLSTFWTSTNPVLSQGEIGIETDTGKKKIGNGTDEWTQLGYDIPTAAAITNTPAGNIAAVTVQAALNELDTEKQAVLVSGTNIKTINSTSLLGSGDIAIAASADLAQLHAVALSF
jgi:broad specificity polyphosphatase/5'/3'-nucleotidase SurE